MTTIQLFGNQNILISVQESKSDSFFTKYHARRLTHTQNFLDYIINDSCTTNIVINICKVTVLKNGIPSCFMIIESLHNYSHATCFKSFDATNNANIGFYPN